MKYNQYDIPPEDGVIHITGFGSVIMSIETLRRIADDDNEKNAQLLENIRKGLRLFDGQKEEEE